LAAPNGSAGAPSFRALVAADIPNLNTSKLTAGTLGVARGGTGKASWTQWGVLYASASTTLANTGAGTDGYPLIGKGSAAPAWYGGQTNAGTAAASWITTFNGTTASTSTSTGAVKISGGLGVAGQVTATRVGINGSNTSYNLYVNGLSYFNGTANINGDITATAGSNYRLLNFSSIELSPSSNAGHGGYIDFHYNGSTADYTTRLIEINKMLIIEANNSWLTPATL